MHKNSSFHNCLLEDFVLFYFSAAAAALLLKLYLSNRTHFIRSLANNFSKVKALDINQLIDLLIT